MSSDTNETVMNDAKCLRYIEIRSPCDKVSTGTRSDFFYLVNQSIIIDVCFLYFVFLNVI